MKLLFAFLIFPLTSFGQNDSLNKAQHDLEGLIIRSHTISNGLCLVGIKGEEKGTGKVYYCNTKDWKWVKTNKDNALGSEVEDVQTVAIVNDSTFLAGTWKNGLFKSTNKGKTWEQMLDFPSKDIRSIKVSSTGLIYAATTSHGILKSPDNGLNWELCSDKIMHHKTAAWSIEIDPKNAATIYALTFGNGILKSTDEGETWQSSLVEPGMMFYDLHVSEEDSQNLLAVASGDSTAVNYYSKDAGAQWYLLPSNPEVLGSVISMVDTDVERLVLGSWNKGVLIEEGEEWAPLSEITFETISGIEQVGNELIVFTWGDGVYRINL